MKLTTSTALEPFADAIGKAAMINAIKAGCEGSYAGALGGLEHLIYSICQQHPEALAVVNDYIARHAPQPNPASKVDFEKMHELLAAEPEHTLEGWTPTSTKAAESMRRQQALERELLRPLREKREAQAKQLMGEYWDAHPQELQALLEEQSSPIGPTLEKSADLWGGPSLLTPPISGIPADTSHAATPVEATDLSSPALPATPESSASAVPPAGIHGQALHAEASSPTAPKTTHAVHALPADSPSACGEAEPSSCSSAHPGEACGDINCDGHCPVLKAA